MSLREKYLKLLSEIIPVGAVGASLLLGSTAPSVANDHPPGLQTSASDEVRVSQRLAAIREASAPPLGLGSAVEQLVA
jgi:hypothetical protein